MDPTFRNIEQAWNYNAQSVGKKCPMGEGITSAMPSQRLEYIDKCLLVMPDGSYKDFLKLKVRGAAKEYLMKAFGLDEKTYPIFERESLLRAKDAIARKRIIF